jgi:hypothetical protein
LLAELKEVGEIATARAGFAGSGGGGVGGPRGLANREDMRAEVDVNEADSRACHGRPPPGEAWTHIPIAPTRRSVSSSTREIDRIEKRETLKVEVR